MGRHYVGLDVSLETTSVCVLDETGAVVWRGKVTSTPEAIAAAVRARAPEVGRIGRRRARCAPGTGTRCAKPAFRSSASTRGTPRRRCPCS